MLCQYGGGRTYAVTRNLQSRSDGASLPKEIAENRFDSLLAELKETVEHGGINTKSAPEKGFANIRRLTELKKSLIEENEKIQEYFGRLESSLKQKGLPGEILNRQASFARDYTDKYEALMARLQGIESAHNDATGFWSRLTGKSKKVNWDETVGQTLKFLQENIPRRRERHFDPGNLPHRSLRADKAIPPKLTREEWLNAFPRDSAAPAAKANEFVFATAPPTSADLAETIEVKFTPEIIKLADSLGKNPVKIFNWVRNNIEFVPTWGSIQGAQLCLETRTGNAFDTASLLIALLRYSGTPARYQMGTIELPVDKFKNWAGGFTNTDAAASLFASAGVPSVVRRVDQTGNVVTIRLEHVWVKAFVDHAPSGGAVNAQGDIWIDLDPSFKQHNFPVPVDLSQFVKISDARAFLNQVLAPATVNQQTGEVANLALDLAQSTLKPDEVAVANYVRANFPQKSVREIIGMGKVIARDLSVLATGLPYRVLIAGTGFAEIPSTLRHRMDLIITDPFGQQSMSFTRSLPELAGTRITFGYAPATSADRQALSALLPANPQQALTSLPATFIDMVPELRINDQVAATGSAGRLGASQNLELRFTAPTVQTPSVVNSISAGEFFAIGLDLQQISPNSLTSLTNRLTQITNEINANSTNPNVRLRELEDLLLNSVAFGWFKEVDFVNQVSAQLSGVVSLRYPSAALAFSDLVPSFLFGSVRSVTFEGIRMDVDRDIIAAVAKDGNSPRTVNYGLVTGAIGSMLEGSLPTQMIRGLGVAGRHSLATTSALGVATTRGGTLVALTQNNFPLVSSRLNVPAGDLQDFQDALNAGMLVFVHERQLVDASGGRHLGHINIDPATGSGSYIIGGAGGAQALRCASSGGRSATDTVVDGMLSSFYSDVRDDGIASLVNLIGPGDFVGKVLSLISLINGVGDNLQRFNNATGAAPDLQLQPLMGLVILLAALDVLKELVTEVLDVPVLGHLITGYLNLISGVAWRMAELFITHFLVIDAAILGIEIPPGCVINLESGS
jgi:transglutaminase-like putative cysteine protease